MSTSTDIHLSVMFLSQKTGTEIVTHLEHMVTPPPAIRKPRELWTGKQVISSILQHTCRKPLPQLHLDGKTRTPVLHYFSSVVFSSFI